MSELTHTELVEKARKWLARKCPVVITEMAGGTEEADAIGWKSWEPILIECKANRSDFRSDSKKHFRQVPAYGMGCRRYFMAPKGMIKINELPLGWGLLEVSKSRVYVTMESGKFEEYNRRSEVGLLLSALQRTGQICPQGVSVRVYKYETKNTATLTVGVEPKQDCTECGDNLKCLCGEPKEGE